VDHGNKVAKVSRSDRGYCAHGGFAVSALAASRCQPFLVFDRADFREDLVRFAFA
jgi:hypothetical protein